VPHIVQRLTRQSVSASCTAGMSERGQVVMADHQHISLLSGWQCEIIARMELPRQVGDKCRKAVDACGGVLVQAKYDADTICLDIDGREIYHTKSSGFLITCIDDVLFYGELIAGTFRIRLQRGSDGAATYMYLEPPLRWSEHLSVCQGNGAYWVTESGTRSLDIFTAAGQLPYMPLSGIH
jgi:hypothetical protein